MKPHERRATGNYPYYKLAVWVPRLLVFRDGSLAYNTATAAQREAERFGTGRYRISVVTADGRRDLEPFDVP